MAAHHAQCTCVALPSVMLRPNTTSGARLGGLRPAHRFARHCGALSFRKPWRRFNDACRFVRRCKALSCRNPWRGTTAVSRFAGRCSSVLSM